jgi:hypothetical protein
MTSTLMNSSQLKPFMDFHLISIPEKNGQSTFTQLEIKDHAVHAGPSVQLKLLLIDILSILTVL